MQKSPKECVPPVCITKHTKILILSVTALLFLLVHAPSWKCSRSARVRLWATWSNQRVPCPGQGRGGTGWCLRSLPTHPILWWFYDFYFAKIPDCLHFLSQTTVLVAHWSFPIPGHFDSFCSLNTGRMNPHPGCFVYWHYMMGEREALIVCSCF